MPIYKYFFFFLLIFTVGISSIDPAFCSTTQDSISHCDSQESHQDGAQDHCLSNCLQSYTIPGLSLSPIEEILEKALLISYHFYYESQDKDQPFQPPKV